MPQTVSIYYLDNYLIRQDASLSADSANNPGYLVLMKCSASTNGSADDACIGWTGDTIYVKPTAETTISLSQIEVREIKGQRNSNGHWNSSRLSLPFSPFLSGFFRTEHNLTW